MCWGVCIQFVPRFKLWKEGYKRESKGSGTHRCRKLNVSLANGDRVSAILLINFIFREFTFTPLYLDFTIHATFFVNSRFTIEKVADSRFTTIKNPIHDHDHILIHDSRPKKSQIHDSRPKKRQIHDSRHPLGGEARWLST